MLCEGHNLEWQKYLSVQEIGRSGGEADAEEGKEDEAHEGVSINMVQECANLFQYLFEQHGPAW